MKLFENVRKIVLPLAFVSVGLFGYFQADAAAPDVDCIDYANVVVDWYGLSVDNLDGYQMWQLAYEWCNR